MRPSRERRSYAPHLAAALLLSAPSAVVGVWAPPASAADAKVDPEVQKHFSLGNQLYKEVKYADALVEYDAAYELSKGNYKILYNRAQCLVMLKREPEAIGSFGKYLDDGGADVPAERRKQVEEEIARLKERLGTIVVAGAPAGTSFELDGHPVVGAPTKDGVGIAAGAGTHELVARPPGGGIPVIKPVKVIAGQDVVVGVDFGPPPAALTPPPIYPAPSNDVPSYPPPPPVARPALGLVSPAVMVTLTLGGSAQSGDGSTMGTSSEAGAAKVLGAADVGVSWRPGAFVEVGLFFGGAAGKHPVSTATTAVDSSTSNVDYGYGNYGLRLRLHPIRGRRIDGWFGFDVGGFRESWKLTSGKNVSTSASSYALAAGLDYAIARTWALGGVLRYLGSANLKPSCEADLECTNAIHGGARGYIEFGLRIVWSIPYGQKEPPPERGTALLPDAFF